MLDRYITDVIMYGVCPDIFVAIKRSNLEQLRTLRCRVLALQVDRPYVYSGGRGEWSRYLFLETILFQAASTTVFIPAHINSPYSPCTDYSKIYRVWRWRMYPIAYAPDTLLTLNSSWWENEPHRVLSSLLTPPRRFRGYD